MTNWIIVSGPGQSGVINLAVRDVPDDIDADGLRRIVSLASPGFPVHYVFRESDIEDPARRVDVWNALASRDSYTWRELLLRVPGAQEIKISVDPELYARLVSRASDGGRSVEDYGRQVLVEAAGQSSIVLGHNLPWRARTQMEDDREEAAPDSNGFREIAAPSYMSVRIELFIGEKSLADATGFLVERHGSLYLITNRHNLRGRNNDTDSVLSDTGAIPNAVEILHNSASALGQWVRARQIFV